MRLVDRHVSQVAQETRGAVRANGRCRELGPLVDEVGGDRTGGELLVFENRPEERLVGGHSPDRYSASVRRRRRMTVSKSRPRHVTFSIIESKYGVISTPW